MTHKVLKMQTKDESIDITNKGVDIKEALSKSLTNALLELNRNGQFKKLTDIYESNTNQSNNQIDLALAARAYLVEGHISKFNSVFSEINKKKPESNSEISLIYLIKSFQLRKVKKWNEALLNAQKAKVFAKKDLNYDFYYDAIFAQAIIATENGYLYKAINYYDQILETKKPLEHRKSLSLTNKVSLLWTLGQVESLKYTVTNLEYNRRLRFQFFLYALDLNKVKIIDSIRQILKTTCEPIELSNILKVLLSLYVVDKENCSLYQSLCDSIVEHLKMQNIQLTENWVLECYSLFLNKQNFLPIYDSNWRENLSKAWLKAASAKEKMLSIYKEEVNALNVKANANCPLYPDLNYISNSKYAYHQKLNQLLHGKILTKKNSDQQARIISLKNKCVSIIDPIKNNSKSVNLSKNPQSLKLLYKINGHKGKVFTKLDLHSALSQNRYASHLHDDRLRKLISRLKFLLQKEFGFEAFCWNGLGELELLCDFETKDDRS